MLPRPFTCCCAVLAIASGFFLYAKKHQTTLLDQQISRIVHETEHVRTQTAMLRTEWTLENQPERLTDLAAHHAAYLRIMEPTQFVRMADLSNRLPAPVKENKTPPTPVAMADASASQPHEQTVAPAPLTSPPQHVQPEHVSVASASAPVVSPAARPQPERTIMTVASAAPVSRPAPAPVQHVSAPPPAAPLPTPHPRVADTASSGASLLAAIQAAGSHRAEAAHATARTELASTQMDMDLKPRTRVASATPARMVAARNTTPDEPAPVRHPLPATVASWHPHLHRATTSGGGYMEARASSGYMGGSLLGRGGDSLPPPVPVTN